MYQKPQSYEVHLLRYRVRQTEFFVIMDHFLPFHPPNITIIRCMLPEKWNMTNIIFCHFGPFFAFLPHYWSQKQNLGINVKKTWRYYPITHVYHKWRSYDVCFLKYKAQQTEFFLILDHFLLFYPPKNLKNQSFEKMKKKKHLKILSFYTCKPQMMIIWCMVPEIWSETEFLSFWTIFALLPP